MIVTLQDVVVLLRVRTDGPPVIGTDDRDRVGECDKLLGVVPPPSAIHGEHVKLTWLCE